MYSIGVDIGYSTAKCVVLNDQKNKIIEKNKFHHGNAIQVLIEELIEIKEECKISDFHIGIVGDNKPDLEEYHINEIASLTEGALHVCENVKSIIQIGAQSSKYITNFSKEQKNNIKFSMNSSCSAGTGSFLEEQVSRLGIKLEEYSSYTEKATQIPRIAGRCSVFSKTDMIHHQQNGTKIEDILLGLAYALARNYRANVVQKSKVETPVIFIGGVAQNKGVVRAIKDVFKFEDKEFIVPKSSSNVGAIGAAIIGADTKNQINLDQLIQKLRNLKNNNEKISNYPALNKFGLGDNLCKHKCIAKTKNIANDVIEGYLGVDIGSTSTNLVLINKQKEVMSYKYLRTKGNPQKSVDEGLELLREEFGSGLKFIGIGTTGSGRKFIGKKINADLIVNEITAQAKGTIEVEPEVDTIFEIGGQDSKYIKIENGRVVDFEMNKICAAGTGSFIEEQAKKLEIEIEDYQEIALKGEKPLSLGDRCTVFIEGNISKALSNGHSKEDITAGLSYSIANNYLNKVVVNKPIGNKIFLQGGIAHNQSVTNAFRSVLGKEINVPPYFSVTGALGAALLTKEQIENHNDLKSKNTKEYDMESMIKEKLLNDYNTKLDSKKQTIGIPRVLFIHKLFPIFNEFFTQLGFNVILSPETTPDMVAKSQEYSLDETCYPIKLINGHVAYLMEQKVDYIFLPSLYTMTHPISKTREDYACVYMQTMSQIVQKTMGLEASGIKLLSPVLSFKLGKDAIMKTLIKVGAELGKSSDETSLALVQGLKKFKKFEEQVKKLGEELINTLEPDEKAFVIITRIYGIADPGLNMGIPKKLRDLGYKVLTLSNVESHEYDLFDEYPNMYWPFGQHILSGAKVVRNHKNLYAIYLTNHGCGPDGVISHHFEEEMKGKPYLHLEVDEHSSDIGVMTRIEAFIESIKNTENIIDQKLEINADKSIDTNKIEKTNSDFNTNINSDENEVTTANSDISKKSKTYYMQNMYPYSQLIQKLLKTKGYNIKLLKETNDTSIEIGKKYTASMEYFTMTATIGNVMSQINDIEKEKAEIIIPRTEGSETFGQYSRIIKQKLKNEEYKVTIKSPYLEDLIDSEEYGKDISNALIAGDIIMSANKDTRDIYLEQIIKAISENKFNQQLLLNIAKEIKTENDKSHYEKSIYAIGEIEIVFNKELNHRQLEKLEEKHKIYYQPISEIMYLEWLEYLKKEKKAHEISQQNMIDMKLNMKEISEALGMYSSFETDLDAFVEKTDKIIPKYRGGNGRYRLTKMSTELEPIHGIIHMSSMYENTATILKLINNQKTKPMIELSFDSSKHSKNDEKIQNFIYYI